MPYSTINGSNAFSWSALWSRPNFYGSVWVPATRLGHSGKRPVLINVVEVWASGYGRSATPACYISGQYIGSTTVPNSGTRGISANLAKFSGGSYFSESSGNWQTFNFHTGSTAIHMSYRQYNNLDIRNDLGYVWWNKTFNGGFSYIEVPSAPTDVTSIVTNRSMQVNFKKPVNDGGSAISGYRIQIATNSLFTANVSEYNTSATSHTIKNLLPGTKYWVRVFAKNTIFDKCSEGSSWSAVHTATTIIDPPVWIDSDLSSIMRIDTEYSDGVSASTAAGSTVDYFISSGTLPAGLSIDPNTGSISGTITGNAGTQYNFSVSARNSGGTIEKSFSRTTLSQISAWTDNVIQTEMRVALEYIDGISATGNGIEYSVGQLQPSPPNYYEFVPGVQLDRISGVISGTPTSPGTYSIDIYATNDSGGYVSQQFMVTVKPTGKRYADDNGIPAQQYINIIRKWDGTKWSDISNIKKWDGNSWVNMDMQ